jgi:hypothetical protein
MYGAPAGATYVDANGPFAALDDSLSPAYLESLWVNAGGPHQVMAIAAAIALAESAGVPNAVNPVDNYGAQTSWGLWQLSDGTHNAPGSNWADPQQNAAGAVAKYNNAGKSFSPWGTYNSGKYNDFLAETQRPARSYTDPYNATADAQQGDNLLEQGINTATGGFYDKAKSALNTANNIALIPQHIMDNLGPFLVGMMLLAIGGLMMTFSWGEHLVNAIDGANATKENVQNGAAIVQGRAGFQTTAEEAAELA